MSFLTDEYFMHAALKEAARAQEDGEIPVGAVIVSNQHIIARAYNQVEKLRDATAHAEMLALTAACSHVGSKYLSTCTLYVTLEPCCMCAAATYWAQLGRLVFGAHDLKRGYNALGEQILHPRTKVTVGVLDSEAAQLLTLFFQNLRI